MDEASTSNHLYPLTTVGGLIVAPDGDILVVRSQKWHNLITVPGGKVEKGETREEAFAREVKEETGLDVVDIRFAIVQDAIFSEEFYQRNHFVMNDFIAKLAENCKKGDVVLNEEAEEFFWVSPEDALKMPLTKETVVLMEWYLAHKDVVL